jgi:hypothetical protein
MYFARMRLAVPPLDPSVDRMVVVLRKPEQPVTSAVLVFTVAEIEQPPRGASRVKAEEAGISKPLRTT